MSVSTRVLLYLIFRQFKRKPHGSKTNILTTCDIYRTNWKRNFSLLGSCITLRLARQRAYCLPIMYVLTLSISECQTYNYFYCHRYHWKTWVHQWSEKSPQYTSDGAIRTCIRQVVTSMFVRFHRCPEKTWK